MVAEDASRLKVAHCPEVIYDRHPPDFVEAGNI
jgi:hypothetical protein